MKLAIPPTKRRSHPWRPSFVKSDAGRSSDSSSLAQPRPKKISIGTVSTRETSAGMMFVSCTDCSSNWKHSCTDVTNGRPSPIQKSPKHVTTTSRWMSIVCYRAYYRYQPCKSWDAIPVRIYRRASFQQSRHNCLSAKSKLRNCW